MLKVGWFMTVLFVTGCAPGSFDPYQRVDTWAPADNNDANLHVNVANPQDLIAGTGQGAAAGAEAAPPVARVLAGKRYPLPALNAADINVFTQQPQQGNANPGSTR